MSTNDAIAALYTRVHRCFWLTSIPPELLRCLLLPESACWTVLHLLGTILHLITPIPAPCLDAGNQAALMELQAEHLDQISNACRTNKARLPHLLRPGQEQHCPAEALA